MPTENNRWPIVLIIYARTSTGSDAATSAATKAAITEAIASGIPTLINADWTVVLISL
jgi:hypothetical protein